MELNKATIFGPYKSPLARIDVLPEYMRPLPTKEEHKTQEEKFTNDAIKNTVYKRSRRLPIVPSYDAKRDVAASGYIQSPRVKQVMSITIYGKEKKVKRNVNKLSSRRRCIPTPDECAIWGKEDSFVNDAIKSERGRTKYKDTVLPKYDAIDDPLCRGYFRRKDIHLLLVRTTPDSLPRIASSQSTYLSDTARSYGGSKNSTPVQYPRIGYKHYTHGDKANKQEPNSRENSPENRLSPGERLAVSPYRTPRRPLNTKSESPTRESPSRNSPSRSYQTPQNQYNMPTTRSPSKNSMSKGSKGSSPSKGQQVGNNNNNNNNNNNGSSSQSEQDTLSEGPLAQKLTNRNKLSYRKRCVPTPSGEKLKERESQFVLDSITSARAKNKYKDMIPPYNAASDPNAKAYFRRQDVKKLISVTCTLNPWEKDVKKDTC